LKGKYKKPKGFKIQEVKMRTIKISKTWQEEDPTGNKMEVSLIEVLNVLTSMRKPEDMPRGLDKARLFNRLIKAFDQAKETKELILEESDYSFLKSSIEKDLPAAWGKNQDMMDEIEVFLETKQEGK
jgi:hypothetical protein